LVINIESIHDARSEKHQVECYVGEPSLQFNDYPFERYLLCWGKRFLCVCQTAKIAA